MTNKGKVITAVVVAAVVLVGAAGFYFKGGDLMGRMRLKLLPAYNEQASCPEHAVVVFGYSSLPNVFYSQMDFATFYNGVKADIDKGKGSYPCTLRFLLENTDSSNNLFYCQGTEVSTTKASNGDLIVICNKKLDTGGYSKVTLSYDVNGVHSSLMVASSDNSSFVNIVPASTLVEKMKFEYWK